MARLRPLLQDGVLDSYHMLTRLQLALFLGAAFVIAYALQYWGLWRVFFMVLGVGFVGAGASFLAGFLLGFVFGLPRTSARHEAPPPAAPGSQAPPTTPTSPVDPNPNLEEISDWLTKIIVGVGLVELSKIPDKMKSLAEYLARGLRNCTTPSCVGGSEALAMGIIVFFSVGGFLVGYIWTRLYMPKALAEAAGLKQAIEAAKEWVYIALARGTAALGWGFAATVQPLDRGLQKYPFSPDLHLEKARMLKKFATEKGDDGTVHVTDPDMLEQALVHTGEASRLNPNSAIAMYNTACYQALLNKGVGQVLVNLKRAIELDPTFRQTAKSDADLAGWRDRPELREVLGA
jgi:hypothetical protein